MLLSFNHPRNGHIHSLWSDMIRWSSRTLEIDTYPRGSDFGSWTRSICRTLILHPWHLRKRRMQFPSWSYWCPVGFGYHHLLTTVEALNGIIDREGEYYERWNTGLAQISRRDRIVLLESHYNWSGLNQSLLRISHSFHTSSSWRRALCGTHANVSKHTAGRASKGPISSYRFTSGASFPPRLIARPEISERITCCR